MRSEERERSPRVLHVTECYGGGVGRAVDNVARLLPGAEHHLLWRGDDVADLDRGFSSLTALPQFIPAAIVAVRQAVRAVEPDVVFAHSSWAGVFSRVIPLDVPVVYQPHCYKFDDSEQNPLVRRAYFFAERALARRSDVTVVLSPHEEALAKSLSRSIRTEFVPNSATLLPSDPDHGARFEIDQTVVMNGRIAPQKDPEFFAAVARAVTRQRPSVRFKWIGDGDPVLREVLEDAGVEVTGWVSGDQLAEILAQPALYFHSARYEGFPLSILDAAAFEHAIAVRSIPAYAGLPIPQADSVHEAAMLIERILDDDAERQRAERAAVFLNESMSEQVQRDALNRLLAPYGVNA